MTAKRAPARDRRDDPRACRRRQDPAWTASEAAEARMVLGTAPAITGVVAGDDGRPLPGAWVGASVLGAPTRSARCSHLAPSRPTRPAASLPVEPDIELARGPRHQVICAAGARLASPTTSRRTLDFHLAATATVEGVVVEAAARRYRAPRSASRVRLFGVRRRAISRPSTVAAGGGRFSIVLPSAAISPSNAGRGLLPSSRRSPDWAGPGEIERRHHVGTRRLPHGASRRRIGHADRRCDREPRGLAAERSAVVAQRAAEDRHRQGRRPVRLRSPAGRFLRPRGDRAGAFPNRAPESPSAPPRWTSATSCSPRARRSRDGSSTKTEARSPARSSSRLPASRAIGLRSASR